MKLIITGYKEDIDTFKEMLIQSVVCAFINNEDVFCLGECSCKECIESHIEFIERPRC